MVRFSGKQQTVIPSTAVEILEFYSNSNEELSFIFRCPTFLGIDELCWLFPASSDRVPQR